VEGRWSAWKHAKGRETRVWRLKTELATGGGCHVPSSPFSKPLYFGSHCFAIRTSSNLSECVIFLSLPSKSQFLIFRRCLSLNQDWLFICEKCEEKKIYKTRLLNDGLSSSPLVSPCTDTSLKFRKFWFCLHGLLKLAVAMIFWSVKFSIFFLVFVNWWQSRVIITSTN
jgi:hypothetical protein